MDNHSVYRNTIDSSQFLTRLVKLPVINSAITVASDLYGKAKVCMHFIQILFLTYVNSEELQFIMKSLIGSLTFAHLLPVKY